MKAPRFTYVLVFGLGVVAVLAVQGILGMLATCHQKYDLLSPIRRCGDTLAQGEWNYEPLREALSRKKEELKAAGMVTHLSLYFQDLDHGPRFGIGEYDQFQPASLVKLPVFIFFLHAADLDPALLDRSLSYTGSLDIADSVTEASQTIEPDTPYSIRELLRKMIVYSDNRSYVVLTREMNVLASKTAYTTFRDLDVLQLMLKPDSYIPISLYAKLYAVLYNMGYLSRDMSQFALQLLSDAVFHEGIVAGLPEGTRVAHKFGYSNLENEQQLHDCGIIYNPKMAYILCLMTTGPDLEKANSAIVEVTRMVNDAVSSVDQYRL